MSRLVHLSDLHFGKDRPDLLMPLLDVVNGLSADLVIISGDLTQRAREREYLAARRFLDQITAPVMSIPGNHDIPLHRPFTRFFAPWRYYRRLISRDLAPVIEGADFIAVGMNTVDRFKWQTGRLGRSALRRACTEFADAPKNKLRVLITHHPLDHPKETHKRPIPGARRALDQLLDCGADIILSGHLHLWHAGTFAHRARHGQGHTAIQLHAGTSLSSRQRGEPNDFNVIDITVDHVTVERNSFNDATGQFKKAEARRFDRALQKFID